VARLIAVTWWLHMKMLNRSTFEFVLNVVWPMFFATAALLIYRIDGDRDVLVYAALGASVMSVWTAISSAASGVLQRERGAGTLELLVAAPTPLQLSVMAIVMAVSTVGAYSIVATLLWARLAFGVQLSIAAPLPFAGAVLATVGAFAVLGFVLSVTVIRYRAAWALGAALEYPVWLVCGFLVRPAALPVWMRPASWFLPPSWGMEAIRAAADGRAPWAALGACVSLTACYGVFGVRLTRSLLHAARRDASLSLT
jgi:ABC-2 type transport system permease protein